MRGFRKEFIETRDLDCFFKCGGIYVHISTFGGDLPDWLNDKEKILSSQKQVFNLEDIFDDNQIVKNERYVNEVLFGNYQGEEKEESINNYYSWFTNIARKGFYSFDRSNLYEREDNRYHLVAYPKYTMDFDLNLNLVTVNADDMSHLLINKSFDLSKDFTAINHKRLE